MVGRDSSNAKALRSPRESSILLVSLFSYVFNSFSPHTQIIASNSSVFKFYDKFSYSITSALLK